MGSPIDEKQAGNTIESVLFVCLILDLDSISKHIHMLKAHTYMTVFHVLLDPKRRHGRRRTVSLSD